MSSQLERAASSIWNNAGMIAGRPRHYDPILSGLLYGEVHIVIQSTKDLAKIMKDKRAIRASKISPVTFTCISPISGYPVWDGFGLAEYASKQRMRAHDARSKLGPDVAPGSKATDWVEVWDYWSIDQHVAWVDGDKGAAFDEPNKLDFIPVVCVLTEGSNMFTREGQNQRQPVLYPVWKSKLWNRQNQFLTLVSSLAYALVMPQFVFESSDETAAPMIDWKIPGGLWKLRNGERISQLQKQLIDTAVPAALEIGRASCRERV